MKFTRLKEAICVATAPSPETEVEEDNKPEECESDANKEPPGTEDSVIGDEDFQGIDP